MGNTIIEKGCTVIAEDGSELILNNAYISSGTLIRSTKDSIINIQSSFIGRNCIIVAKVAIEINKNCEIAEMDVIRDQDHKHDLTERKIAGQGFNSSPIKIGENIWIGSKSTILKGVEIGSNSIIGAHTLVNKSVPTSSISVGIPVKIIKENG